MRKRFLLFLIAFCINVSAKDELLYSYQAKLVDFTNQPIMALMDSIIGHLDTISCSCENDDVAYNVSFVKTTDWPLDKRVVIGIYVDKGQNYLQKEWKDVSYLEYRGKRYRINIDVCCEDEADWVSAISSDFFVMVDSVTLKKYKRIYTDEEFQELHNRGCMMEEDGGTEIYFVYEDGVLTYWRGRFCDGSIITL